MACVFCGIVAGNEPASRIYADEDVTAFMALHPSSPGECLVIPNVHVDHFTDLEDRLASRVMVVAQRIGRRMRTAFKPERVGYVVHGYGVPHAHLIVVPQNGPYDITSARFAGVEDGKVVFRVSRGNAPDRDTLDRQAAALSRDNEPMTRNLTSINPFLIVENLQASVAYYAERFGFQLDYQGPGDDPYYGRVSRDGIGIMLKAIVPEVLPRPNRTRHEWARWDAFIYTLDPDPLFEEFRRRGASFVTELSFIDEGLWGFEVTDGDGYVLAFACVRHQ